MLADLLSRARLLEVTERSSAYNRSANAAAQQDSRPVLVFDTGVLHVENPFSIACDSGEHVTLRSLIGCYVSATFSTDTEFYLVFEGRISLRVSMREEDFIGPGAASFRDNSGKVISVR